MNYFKMSIWIFGCLLYAPLFLQNPLGSIIRFFIMGIIIFYDPFGLIPNNPPAYAKMENSEWKYHWNVYKDKIKKIR